MNDFQKIISFKPFKIRVIILLILIIFPRISKGQIDVDYINELKEVTSEDNFFATIPLDTSSNKKTYIELCPPKFDTMDLLIDKEFILKNYGKLANFEAKIITCYDYTNWEKGEQITNYDMVVEPEHFKRKVVIWRRKYLQQEYILKPNFKIINSDTIVPTETIHILTLRETSKIRILTKEEANLSQNTIIEAIGDNWINWREVFEMPHKYRKFEEIAQIQKRLIEIGYEIKITRQMDEKTKNALLDFQRKNKLKIGKLDFQTMKALFNDYD